MNRQVIMHIPPGRDRIESSAANNQSLQRDVIGECNCRDVLVPRFRSTTASIGYRPCVQYIIITSHYDRHRFWFYHHHVTSGVNHADANAKAEKRINMG